MNNPNAENRINQVRAAYDTIAAQFSRTRSSQWKIVNQLLTTHSRPGQALLDVGCGNGRVAELASAHGLDYIGCDLSDGLLAAAQENHPNTKFVQCDMRSLPFPDQSVDLVCSIAAFHHLPDRASRLVALAECKRVLRPGGLVLLTNWNLWQPRYWRLHVNALWRRLQGQALHVGDTMVPWKNSTQITLAERYYHAFRPRELGRLYATAELTLIEQFYERAGKLTNWRRGYNLISILQR